ncbi:MULTISPECIES: TlpA family protein disulfide reductase [Chitinophagaceae]
MKMFFSFLFFLCVSNIDAQNMMQQIAEKSNTLPYQQTAQRILQYGEKLRQPHLPAEQQKIIAQYNALNGSYKDSVIQYIQANPNTETSGILALSYYFDIQKDSGFLRQALRLMQGANVQNQYAHYISDELNGLDSAQVGKLIPVFEMIDLNRNMQHFPNGKKTLLNFWASWCVPCRAENETLKKQYVAIQQKGTEICSVNIDDDKNRWLLASKQDQLPWANCFAGNGFGSRIARFFTIHQIPQNVLLDENGKILARNISINQLLK